MKLSVMEIILKIILRGDYTVKYKRHINNQVS